jgi:prepilin-type N-terminal cleavage/methylation domain-containing protein
VKYPARAFTLIEVAACLVLLGLLAGLVAVSLHQARRQASFEDGIAQVIAWDRRCRDEAQRMDRVLEMTVDPQTSTARARVVDAEGMTQGAPDRMPLVLPWGLRIASAWSGDSPDAGPRLTIRCDPHGRTSSYALEVQNAAGRSQWVFFAGGSGQPTRWETEDEMATMWAAAVDGPRADFD